MDVQICFLFVPSVVHDDFLGNDVAEMNEFPPQNVLFFLKEILGGDMVSREVLGHHVFSGWELQNPCVLLDVWEVIG